MMTSWFVAVWLCVGFSQSKAAKVPPSYSLRKIKDPNLQHRQPLGQKRNQNPNGNYKRGRRERERERESKVPHVIVVHNCTSPRSSPLGGSIFHSSKKNLSPLFVSPHPPQHPSPSSSSSSSMHSAPLSHGPQQARMCNSIHLWNRA